MRVLIVDDEPAARERLALLLEELDAEVVGQAANGVEALELAARHRPEVLLLDIAMPEVDGFDVVRHLPEPRPLVIFQTAYDEFALQAFEHEALDYVVKPVSLERLGQALERAARRLEAAPRAGLAPELLERLRGLLAGPAGAVPARVLVRDGSGRRLLPLGEVTRFAAEDGLVEAHAGGRGYLTDYTLAELESRLGAGFVRANRSELVNLERVRRIDAEGDGTATLTLADDTRVHVSRRRAVEVRQALER